MLKILGILGIVTLLAANSGDAGEDEALFEEMVVVPLSPTTTHRGITGTILEINDGSLLFVYSACEDTLFEETNGVAARRSEDVGRTWSEPWMLQPKAGLAYTGHPALLRLADGNIMFSYSVQNLTTDSLGIKGDQHQYVRLSDDEGETWTHPLCATFVPGICQSYPDKTLQLSTGRIIMPVDTGYPVDEARWVSMVFYSDNGGYGWWPSENFVDLNTYETGEPSVAELADGRLIMLCRTTLGYLGRSYSEDQGETWGEPELAKDLPAGLGTPFHMVRLPTTGDLLCIWCNNPHGAQLAAGEEQPTVQVAQLERKLGYVRSPLSSAISRDGGLTWEHHRNIAEDPEGVYGDYGYPGIDFIEDGKVALVNYNAIDGIRLARIHIDWLYGK